MILKGENIICFAPHPWEDTWRRRHQVLSRLAVHNKILFIEPPIFWGRRILKEQSRRYVFRLKAQEVLPNLFALPTTFVFPFSRYSPIATLNSLIILRLVAREVRRLGLSNPIMWAYLNPITNRFRGRYSEKLVVYDCYDKYTGYAVNTPAENRQIESRELDLAKQADLVFAVSPQLAEYHKRAHSRVFMVPNGVDVNLIASSEPAKEAMDELERIPRPRVGYVGQISPKLDFELLAYVARSNPQWSLVFIGPEIMTEELAEDVRLLKDLKGNPNVHFLGSKPYHQLASYIDKFDVCLMPFKQDSRTESSSPIKFYEYCACGKPTVSVPIPALAEHRALYYEAATKEGFAMEIGRALAESGNHLKDRRISFAHGNTWDSRIEYISRLIYQTLLHGE